MEWYLQSIRVEQTLDSRAGGCRGGKSSVRAVGMLLAGMFLSSSQLMGQVLDVALIPQRGSLWCWAASSEMVLDYLAPTSLYSAAVGQCTLAQSVLEPRCACKLPNDYESTDPSCRRSTPFGHDDFIPQLLPSVIQTSQPYGRYVPIDRDLLTCEIADRRRPVVAWWREIGVSCEDNGHLVVVSGIKRDTTQGDLVLVLNPWPLMSGDRYWLTWRGFGCGWKRGGHCVDYYNVQGRTGPSRCDDAPSLDTFECGVTEPASFEIISDIAKAEEVVGGLINGVHGPEITAGLALSISGFSANGIEVHCDEGVLVRGAQLAYSAEEVPSLLPIGTTRLLCELRMRLYSVPFSVLLFDDSAHNWVLAGFGAANLTDWLQRSAQRLIGERYITSDFLPSSIDPDDSAGEPVELFEVIIYGTGDNLLILPDGEGGYLGLHYSVERDQNPRPLSDLLKEPIDGESAPTLDRWLRRLRR